MTASGPELPTPGTEIPSPPWWRPFKNVPLIMLAVASLVAAVVGWTASAVIAQENAKPASTVPVGDALGGAQCRPAVPAPDAEPWIDGDGSAEQVWDDAIDPSAPVVAGRDGWAFYNDQIEENFSQGLGRRYLTVGEASAWRDYFGDLADGLAAQDIELVIQITPSATSIYPDMLPEWADGLRGSTPLDQLLASAPGIPVVDARAALLDAAQDDAVFTPVNSHWTDWGGYIGWQAFADCREALWGSTSAVPAVDGVESDGVFNEFAQYGVADATPEWTSPVFAEALPRVTVTTPAGTEERDGDRVVDLSDLPAETANPQAHSTQTALILRDSMGNALSPFWANEFAVTHQLQHRYDDWSSPPNYRSLVEQYRPDIVIVQLAERHLVNAPAPGVTAGF